MQQLRDILHAPEDSNKHVFSSLKHIQFLHALNLLIEHPKQEKKLNDAVEDLTDAHVRDQLHKRDLFARFFKIPCVSLASLVAGGAWPGKAQFERGLEYAVEALIPLFYHCPVEDVDRLSAMIVGELHEQMVSKITLDKKHREGAAEAGNNSSKPPHLYCKTLELQNILCRVNDVSINYTSAERDSPKAFHEVMQYQLKTGYDKGEEPGVFDLARKFDRWSKEPEEKLYEQPYFPEESENLRELNSKNRYVRDIVYFSVTVYFRHKYRLHRWDNDEPASEVLHKDRLFSATFRGSLLPILRFPNRDSETEEESDEIRKYDSFRCCNLHEVMEVKTMFKKDISPAILAKAKGHFLHPDRFALMDQIDPRVQVAKLEE